MSPKSQQAFSIKKRLKSFKYAFAGLRTSWREEHNMRIHLLVAVLVVILGAFLRLSTIEWICILVVMVLVFVSELINSSIENLADALTVEQNKRIGKAKDLAAAAVLMSALLAVVVGMLILGPKIWQIIKPIIIR